MLHIIIITFSVKNPPMDILSEYPSMKLVDCSKLPPPPPELCNRHTGLTREIRRSFFSIPGNYEFYQRVIESFIRRICNWHPANGSVFVVPVACMAGVHRSVATAERIAKKISLWSSCPFKLKVRIEHSNIWPAMKFQSNRSRSNEERFLELAEMVRPGRDGVVRRVYVHGEFFDVR